MESFLPQEVSRRREVGDLLLAGHHPGFPQHPHHRLRALQPAGLADRSAGYHNPPPFPPPLFTMFTVIICPLIISPCHLLPPARCGQQGPAGHVHAGDVDQDVQPGAAGLLCVALQPLRLLCGVRWHRGDHPGGAGHHVPAGHLCLPLRAAAPHLQGHTVSAVKKTVISTCFLLRIRCDEEPSEEGQSLVNSGIVMIDSKSLVIYFHSLIFNLSVQLICYIFRCVILHLISKSSNQKSFLPVSILSNQSVTVSCAQSGKQLRQAALKTTEAAKANLLIMAAAGIFDFHIQIG